MIWIIVWIITGIIGASMAENRGRSAIGGFALGFLLSLVGLAVIALMGQKEGRHEYR